MALLFLTLSIVVSHSVATFMCYSLHPVLWDSLFPKEHSLGYAQGLLALLLMLIVMHN